MEQVIMLIGFGLASYSVIANDVIQTLGTFLSSNAKKPWLLLWSFAGTVLIVVLLAGWLMNEGDVTYGRLALIPYPDKIQWWLILPPLALLLITQAGIPVSTTFMILSIFSTQQVIEKMVIKSITGYAVAFVTALLIYLLIARSFEEKSSADKAEVKKNRQWWLVAQWFSTGFLWAQWLIQDFANIYVYLPRKLSLTELLVSLVFLLLLLAVVFRKKGGKIQNIVKRKTNSANIRSATLIDLSYGIVLYFFTVVSPIPMSTTWTFVGILAGREYAITLLLKRHTINDTYKDIFRDLFKVNIGLAISIIIAMAIHYLRSV
ncbi:MAG: hypothetical protein HC819_17230 [Cyclobacteriaceae bacterium]|nr:hypothetical protein [Cyclobacteriaceae bacterium]